MIESTDIVLKRNKTESILYNVIYILTVIGLFLLNWDKTNEKNEQILLWSVRGITSLYILILFLLVTIKRLAFSRNEFFVGLCILFLATIVGVIGGFNAIQFMLLPFFLCTALYVTKSDMRLNHHVINVSLVLIFISFIIQFSIFRFQNRPMLSIGDPNYSGYFIFCVYLFCRKVGRKKMSYLFLILGAITLSRAFLLAFFVYLLLSYFKKWQKPFKKMGFAITLILSNVILLVMGHFFIVSFSKERQQEIEIRRDLSEIFSYKDDSNYHRFLANKSFWEDVLKNPKKNLYGRKQEEYNENVFPTIPHNTVFQVLVEYGILVGTLYLLCLFYLFRLNYNDTNIPYTISILIYFLFLGGAVFGLLLVFLFIILGIKQPILKT
jgi:hypothetical protein